MAYDEQAANQQVKKPMSPLRLIGIILGVLLVVLAIAGGMFYFSAQRVFGEAATLSTNLQTFATTLTSNDAASIRESAGQVNKSAHTIQNETSGPLWAAAEALPVFGVDVHAARTLADVSVDLSDNVLVPLAENANYLTLDGYLTEDGLELDGIPAMLTFFKNAEPVVHRSREAMDALEKPVTADLREAVDTTRDALALTEDGLSLLNDAVDSLQNFGLFQE